MTAKSSPEYIDGPNGRLAYRLRPGARSCPMVVWFGGLKSDMLGTKAEFLDGWAKNANCSYLRFDYSGHGESDGEFENGSIGEWAADAETIVNTFANESCIFVGSSMGAWVSTLVALRRPQRLAGAIFIAPAPDFTERLLWPTLSTGERQDLKKTGRIERASEYENGPEVFTKKLFDDGRANAVMERDIDIRRPVRILHGMRDEVVPWIHAVDFAEKIVSDDVEIALAKAGDHRLSSETDLDRLASTLAALIDKRPRFT